MTGQEPHRGSASVLAAFSRGAGLVRRAPWLIVGLWLMTLLVAMPLALTLRSMLGEHLGQSLAADAAARGVNYDWWNEFLAQAAGLGQTFVPAIIGFAAVLRNLSDVADARGLPTAMAWAVAVHIVISMFLLGGVLDRLARGRAIGAAAFFAACGTFFFRFLRLGAVAAAVYGALFAWLHPWLFETFLGELTADVTSERTAFFCRAMLYVIFAAVLLVVNVVFDYAKIRAVVEDRRSMIGTLVAGGRFVARHPSAALGLALLNTLLFAALLLAYAFVAPGVSGGARFWLGLVTSQAYIALRVTIRLQFAASQIALFQSRLAHAGYVATPVPTWPESPMADAIRADTHDRGQDA